MTLLLAAGAVVFSLAFASPAAAGGGHHDRHGHGALHAAVAGLAVYSAVSHSRRHDGHRSGRHHARLDGRHHRRGHRSGHSDYYRDDGCHKVYKHGYYHGRKARIGGTQCYDSYGNPYIVRGSRYVVEYY